MPAYPITLHHLLVSPKHRYFGRPAAEAGIDPDDECDEIFAQAGLGVAGDRYFGVAAHFTAQITFVAIETFREVAAALGTGERSPLLMRRNVVVEGMPVMQLIGLDFAIECAGERVEFAGGRHCAPCRWMDAMLGDGAQQLLRGRGGLRAQIVAGGRLRRGAALLHCDLRPDQFDPAGAMRYPRLP